MTEQNVDVVVRARDLTREAFKQIEAALAELDKKVEDKGKKMTLSFSQVKDGITAAAGAITAVAGGIVTLGARGAKVDDLKASFDQMNAAIGNDSVVVLQTLQSSFAGTISDAETLRIANEAMTMGLKASKEDFALLADAARVLADRTGTSTVVAFEKLSKAMAIGKTTGAEALIGIIDNAKAHLAYSGNIGKTVDKMSEQEKVEATAIVMKQRMHEVLASTGKAQVDFGDKVDQSKAKLTNFVDGLGKWVAMNPELGTFSSVVTAASGSVTAIGLAWGPLSKLVSAFPAQMFSATAAVNLFRLTALGPLGVALAGIIGSIYAVKGASADTGWLREISDAYQYAALRVQGYSAAQSDLMIATQHVTKEQQEQQKRLNETTGAIDRYKKMHDMASAEMVKSIEAAQKKGEMLATLSERTKKAAKETEEYNERQQKQAETMRSAQKEMQKLMFTTDQIRNMSRGLTFDGLIPMATELTNTSQKWVVMNAEMERSKKLHETLRNLMTTVNATVPGAGMETLKREPGFLDMLTGLPGKIKGLFSGENMGDFTGGMTSKITGAFAGLFGGGKGGGLLSSIVGGGMGSMFGPVGGIISNLAMQGMQKLGEIVWSGLKKVGAFFKDLFGGPSAEELAGREIVAKFESNIQSMLTEVQKLESGNESWKKTIIALRDAYIAQGLSEREALRDAEALWGSSKRSAEEQARIVEDITRKMGKLSVTIPVNFDVSDLPSFPATPEFSHGGVIDAGAGALAMLHGREAVIPIDRPSMIGAQIVQSAAQFHPLDNSGRDFGLVEEIRGLRGDFRLLGGQIKRSIRDGLLAAQ